MIVLIINDFQSEGLAITLQLTPAELIFLDRNDVGIAEEYGRPETLADHPFDNGRGAWGAAAMQQDALPPQVATLRQLRSESAGFKRNHTESYGYCRRKTKAATFQPPPIQRNGITRDVRTVSGQETP